MVYGISISMGSIILTYLANTYFFWKTESALQAAGISSGHPIYLFIYEQKRFMDFVFLIVSVISVTIGGCVGYVLSHRVAGPLHRMRKHLLAIAAGRAPRFLKFRKNDYFQELADAYNEELRNRGKVRRPGSEPSRQEIGETIDPASVLIESDDEDHGDQAA
jgi:sensor histidine kinase YesM